MADTTQSRSVGRRKTASARVRLSPGTGTITINGKTLTEYLPIKLSQEKARAPLSLLGKEKDYDISIKVAGGGKQGQADAICHGIARALIAWNAEFKPVLKAGGFTTRDPRAKERKKPGLRRARRGHQWRKR